MIPYAGKVAVSVVVVITGFFALFAMGAIVMDVFQATVPRPPEYILVEVKIIDQYKEMRIGTDDHSTVVEFSDGTREVYEGKLGEVGETFKVRVRND